MFRVIVMEMIAENRNDLDTVWSLRIFAASYSKRPIVCKSIIQHVVGTDEKCKFVNSNDKEQTENGTVVWNHANAWGFQFEKTLFSI